MAKQFLDYTGLEHYDGKIKAWANNNFAKTGFNNVAFGTNKYTAVSLDDTIKFAGTAISSVTSETGTITVNLTDEHATLTGHYSPDVDDATSIAVTATKLSTAAGAGDSIEVVYGVNKDPKGHILGLTTKTINIPAAIEDSTISSKENNWVNIEIVEEAGKLKTVSVDDSKIDALPQVAFKTIKVGTTNIDADSATDTLTIVGDTNITLTPDATKDEITIKANYKDLNAVCGNTSTYVGVNVTQTNGLITSVTVSDSIGKAIQEAIDPLPTIAFNTIAVGSTNIVADSATATLNLEAGDNITLTPDVDNDKVTITANMDFTSLDSTIGVDRTYIGVTVTQTDGVLTNITVDDSKLDAAINSLTQSIQGGTHFRGLTTSSISDGSTDANIKINETDYTAKAGDIVILSGNKKEFIYTGSSWLELGDSSAEAEAISELNDNLSELTKTVNGIDDTVKELPTVAFKTIKVGSTNIEAEGKADTLTIVGDTNITLTPDATNDEITIKANYKDLNTVRGGASTYVGVTVTQTDGLITLVTVSDSIGKAIQEAIDPLPTVAFKTIAVGSTNIDADSATGTLTLKAGNNITLTPDVNKDEVTITANMDFTSLVSTVGVDRTYIGVTVTQADGVLTNITVDDSKLDAAIKALPQFAFKTIKVGSTNIDADSATDTLTIVGDGNITLTPDATNDKITIKANYSDLTVTKGVIGSYIGVTVTQTDGILANITIDDSAIDNLLTEPVSNKDIDKLFE